MNEQLQTLKSLWNYIKRYWLLVLIAVIAGAVMLSIPTFQWIAYGILRLAAATAGALLVRNVVWTSCDKYLDSGDYSGDFHNAMRPWAKVTATIAIGLTLFLGSVLCFCL